MLFAFFLVWLIGALWYFLDQVFITDKDLLKEGSLAVFCLVVCSLFWPISLIFEFWPDDL